MDAAAGDCDAFDEAIVFLKYFEYLPDVRQIGKVRYPLTEVLLLCLLAVLAGAETFVDIALVSLPNHRRQETRSSAPVSALYRRNSVT